MGSVAFGDDGAVDDVGTRCQRSLDFGDVDRVAADLDAIADTAEEVKVAGVVDARVVGCGLREYRADLPVGHQHHVHSALTGADSH